MMYIFNLNKHDVDVKLEKLSGIPVLWAGENLEIKLNCMYAAQPNYGKNIATKYKNRGIVVVESKHIFDETSSDIIIKAKNKSDEPKISKNERFTTLKIGALEAYSKFIDEAQALFDKRQNERRVKGNDLAEPKPERLEKLVMVKLQVAKEIKQLKELRKKKEFPKFEFYQDNSPWAGYIEDHNPGIDYTKEGVGSGVEIKME